MIYILWCTIRPEQFIYNHKIWMDRSSDNNSIETFLAVNYVEHKNSIKNFLKEDNIFVVDTKRIGVCYPSYFLSSKIGLEYGNEIKEDDIIVFASDDFIPPKNWDKYLVEKMKGKGDVSLMVRDGYQLPDSSNMLHPAITIPIMTYGCLLNLNRYIYHPEYHHMYSDCELYLNLKDLDLLYDDRLNDETTFEHCHHVNGKRKSDLADQIYYQNWKIDEETWNKRIKMSVKERLI